jgi:hypothetical protein
MTLRSNGQCQNIRAANWDGDHKTKAFGCKVIFDFLRWHFQQPMQRPKTTCACVSVCKVLPLFTNIRLTPPFFDSPNTSTDDWPDLPTMVDTPSTTAFEGLSCVIIFVHGDLISIFNFQFQFLVWASLFSDKHFSRRQSRSRGCVVSRLISKSKRVRVK